MSKQKLKEVVVKAPKQGMDAVLDAVVKEVEVPPIEDTLAKANAAITAAAKAKRRQKQIQTWCCTECNSSGIQLDLPNGGPHFSVHLEDGEPRDANGNELTGEDAISMKTAMTKRPRGIVQVATLAAEREAKERE